MGCDFIGWRDCPLQAELGPEGFLGKLKLRAYKRAVEERVPVGERDKIEILVQVTNRPPRKLDYPQICADLAAFEAGIPDCASCPLAGGRPLGCYRYVTYPVDAAAEALLFDFFVEELATHDSIGDQLYRDIVTRIDDESAFIYNRGTEGGTLAAREAPLVGRAADGREVNSGKLLATLFGVALEEPALIVAYARLFLELQAYAARRAGLGEDGRLTLQVAPKDEADLPRATQEAVSYVDGLARSRTLEELGAIADLLRAVAPRSIDEGWSVIVDG